MFVCSSLRMRAANGRFPGPVSPSSLDSLGNETEPVKPNTAHCILSCSFLKTTRRSTVCCSSTVSAFGFLFFLNQFPAINYALSTHSSLPSSLRRAESTKVQEGGWAS